RWAGRRPSDTTGGPASRRAAFFLSSASPIRDHCRNESGNRTGREDMLERIFMTGDGLDAIRIALALLSLASAIAYQAIEHRPPSALRTGLKTASIGLLVPLPLLAGTALPFLLLAAAFLFSALGDLFLALKGDPRNFTRGLGAFLASHLFYIAVMLPLASAPETLPLKVTSLAVGIGALALYWSLAPSLGRMKLPVGAYLVVILVMA